MTCVAKLLAVGAVIVKVVFVVTAHTVKAPKTDSLSSFTKQFLLVRLLAKVTRHVVTVPEPAVTLPFISFPTFVGVVPQEETTGRRIVDKEVVEVSSPPIWSVGVLPRVRSRMIEPAAPHIVKLEVVLGLHP